jgi:hypothetical protein
MRPSIDHYFGRPFDSIVKGDENWDWAIQLDGGVQIKNKDQSLTTAPSNLDGSSLMTVTYGELDTTLNFGTPTNMQASVVLTPTLYTISDPLNPSDVEIYPQVPEEVVIPDDPSGDRVADGPTEE